MHQYNELVCVEKLIGEAEPINEDDEEQMQHRHDQAIADLTSGRKRPKKTHSAALTVTLSLQPLPEAELAGKSVTHQPPPAKERLRGRARKRKRRREAEEAREDGGEAEANDMVVADS